MYNLICQRKVIQFLITVLLVPTSALSSSVFHKLAFEFLMVQGSGGKIQFAKGKLLDKFSICGITGLFCLCESRDTRWCDLQAQINWMY